MKEDIVKRQYDGKFILWKRMFDPTVDFEEAHNYKMYRWVIVGVYNSKKELRENGLTSDKKEAKV